MAVSRLLVGVGLGKGISICLDMAWHGWLRGMNRGMVNFLEKNSKDLVGFEA